MQLITFNLDEETPVISFESTGIPGPRGEPFTFDDFTPEQLEALRGPRGVSGSFTYSDLTDKEKQDLQQEVAKDIQGALVNANIPAPFGGYFSSDVESGFVTVTLPIIPASMSTVAFTVSITSTNVAQDAVRVYGAIDSAGRWSSVGATELVGDSGGIRVIFGKENNPVIQIGGSGVTYQKPTVAITDVMVGGDDKEVTDWGVNWDIHFSTIPITIVDGDVIAEPMTPDLTAEDVGALPADGTAKNAMTLDGFSPSTYHDPETIPARDANADIDVRSVRTTLQTQSEIGSNWAGIGFRLAADDDNLLRFADKTAVINWLGKVKDSEKLQGKSLDKIKEESRTGLVPDTITINEKRLTGPIELNAADIGLGLVSNYGNTNSYSGTAENLYATQKAVYDAAAAPRLEEDRKRKITHGTADPVPTGAVEGDIYLKHE